MGTDDAHQLSAPTAWIRKVEAIFHETLGRPAASRRGFLHERCGGDAALLRDVEALLSADERPEAFLDAPALGAAFSMPRPESLANEGSTRRIGPYQLVRLVGSGGMAHVWLAHRVDGHFQKDVAIKLIKRGMDTDAILARFDQERQVLARLEHPNIARLIDGGATDDGLPYLVMEYVNGLAIDRYCREQHLSVSARIVLFREICSAVQYAHQALVIHRDIKPGNILVTADGHPKLLDFGIAKLLEDDPQHTTRRGGALLTPEYASPEQHRGEPVTTASDVFSLGVVLHELLTGLKPTRRRSATERVGPDAADELTRPSTRVLRHSAADDQACEWPEGSAARLARRLRGDLDTILLKALAPETKHRYATVDQLSIDLKLHLEHRPIAARPPTRLYRTRRFIERNKASVAAGAIAMVAVLVALVTTTVAYLQADSARRGETKQRQLADLRLLQAEEAERKTTTEAEKLRTTNAFLQELMSTSDPLMKLRPNVELREVLAEAGRALDAGALRDQPEVEAAIRVTVGKTYKNLRMTDRGELHLRRALEIQSKLPSGENLELAETAGLLAVCLCEQRKFKEGIPLHRRALAIQRALAPGDENTLMNRLWSFSPALRDDGQLAEAESVLREALAIALRLYGPRHKDTAESRFRLGWTLSWEKKYDESETELRTALAIQTELLGEKHPACGESRLRLGLLLENKKQIADAEPLIRDSFRILSDALGPSHPYTLRAKSNLARFLSRNGKDAEAEQLQRESVIQNENYYGPSHTSVADSIRVLGLIQIKRGEWDDAEKSIREALKRHAPALGDDNVTTQEDRLSLAEVLEKQQRNADAEAILLEACSIAEKSGDANAEARRKPVERLIQLYESWCKAEPASEACGRIADWRTRLAAIR
ncbi:MAG TPA: serine/threonine-protein kinase [Phycisphaerae bacterium]|nr:serine/threonine-protein kinase [Phycisphaerae bacterium]